MFKTISCITIQIELSATPYKDWPNEAKTIAFRLLTRSKVAEDFLAIPKRDRKAWLAVQVENEQSHQEFDLFG